MNIDISTCNLGPRTQKWSFRQMHVVLSVAATVVLAGLHPTPFPTEAELLDPRGGEGCTLAEHAFCQVVGAISAEEARQRLGSDWQAYWREDDILHVAARRPENVTAVHMCCALQTHMEPIEPGLWVASYQLPRLDEAFIDVWPIPLADRELARWDDRLHYFGSDAPPPVPKREYPEDRLIREVMPPRAFDHARTVNIYVPPSGAGPHPVVYMADGGNAHGYGEIAEALAAECRARAVIIVGIETEHRDGDDLHESSRLRAADYLWGRDPDRFSAHERFLIDEVMPHIESNYAASTVAAERLISGKSNGAAWAVSTALRHPDLFGSASASSFVWRQAFDAAETVSPEPVFLVSAGLFEPRVLAHSEWITQQIREGGGQVELQRFVSGHSPLAFEQQFAHALEVTFPATPECEPSADLALGQE
ncbi:alpha/beta hydrolase [Maricaulis sp. CAU 1757]